MRKWMVVVAALLVVPACGDDADGMTKRVIRGDTDSGLTNADAGAATSNPTLDSKNAGTLTPSESLVFCDWVLDLEDESLTDEQYCTQQASDEADTPRACERRRDECIDALADEGVETPDCADFSFPRSCTATVGELKACLGDVTKILVAAAKRATCSDPKLGRSPDNTPASCTSAVATCLDLVGGF